MNLRLICDGGCENNQNPLLRWAYGSYLLCQYIPEQRLIVLRNESKISFGNLTNNEAEYLALINALSQIPTLPTMEPIGELRIQMDSKLVINQVCGQWEVNAPNLPLYVQRVRDILRQLKKNGTTIIFNHLPREEIVEYLGH